MKQHIKYRLSVGGEDVYAVSGSAGYYDGIRHYVGHIHFGHHPRMRPNDFEIWDLSVHEDFQRQGIGRELVRRAEAQLKKEGARTVYVEPGDEEAEGFWTAVGYRRYEATPPGDEYPDLRRRLR